MEQKINFRNLLLARESRGITQTELALNIEGLNQGNLSRMEKGLLQVPDEILDRIANFLEFPISLFFKENQNRRVNSFFYRKRVTISSKEISKLEAKFDLSRIAIDELLEAVDIPNFDIPSIPPINPLKPEDIANRIRLFFGLQRGPIDDLVKLLENHGIIIVMLKNVPDKFFGVTMFTNKSQPVVFMNEELSNDSKRFTLGHELGHLVMHLREPDFEKDEKELDKEANFFSSEFNMPTKDCFSDLSGIRYSDLPTIKSFWKLSKSAISYKAKALGFINETQYRYFMMQLSSSGQRKHENENVSLDSPTLLKKIIDVHINDLKYSENELSELTGFSTSDFNDWILYQNDDVRPKMRISKYNNFS